MYRFLLLLLFSIIIPCIALAQSRALLANGDAGGTWISVPNGLEGEVVSAVEWNGRLTILEYLAYDRTQQRFTYRISSWDGLTWETVTTSEFNGVVKSMAIYRDEIYICGYFSVVYDVPLQFGIARWDGAAWRPVGGGMDLGGNHMAVMCEYNGELYCGGVFTSIAGVTVNGIARWNGTRWADVGGGTLATSYGSISSLAVYRGELYAGGIFDKIGNTYTSGIARWDGTEWHAVGNRAKSWQIGELTVYRDALYGTTTTNDTAAPGGIGSMLLQWDGENWDTVTHTSLHAIWSMAALDDRLFIAGADANFDGVSLRYGVGRWDGRSWGPAMEFDSAVTALIAYRDNLYAIGVFSRSGLTPASRMARFCPEGDCGKVTGAVYYDRNDDCSRDTSDRPLRRVIEILPGPYYTMTDSNGNYTQYLPLGSYSVHHITDPIWRPSCPPLSSYDITLTDGGEALEGKDFPMGATRRIENVRVSTVAGRARAGRPALYAITYENIGTVATSGTVRFYPDLKLTFKSSTPPPSRVTAGILEWDFIDLDVDESRTIWLEMAVPTNASIGTQFCGAVDVTPRLLDLGIDGRDTFCITVTGGFDPNDISVTPLGIEGNGEITSADSVLTYTVRFQNTGNDTAFRVVVVDTLSSDLNPASIRFLAASHTYTAAMKGHGVVTWTFDDIMLPDSGANEPNSHGFFKFSVNQRPTLESGTRIPGRVGIYFDYNDPVITNTVISIITGPSSAPLAQASPEVTIAPNPASATLQVRGVLNRHGRVGLCDMLGQSVEARTAWNGDKLTLDCSSLPAGIYFLSLPTASGIITRQVTVTR
jgi:uncharacterized repeat protein (TIGR01451 family)